MGYGVFLGFFLFAVAGCSRPGEVAGGNTVVRGITHGIRIPRSKFAEVVKLRKASGGICTGIFVLADPPTLITASHCLDVLPYPGDTDGGVLYNGVASVAACLPPGAVGRFGPRDFAVVVFPEGTPVPAVATLTGKNPVRGMDVTLVGFGRNDDTPAPESTGSGVKRMGKNYIKNIAQKPIRAGMIHIVGALAGDLEDLEEVEAEHDSGTGHGDSGGALFCGKRLAGINSGGHSNEEEGEHHSYFVNLKDPVNETFLRAALEPAFLYSLLGNISPPAYAYRCALQDAAYETQRVVSLH